MRVLPVDSKFGVAARIEGYEYLPKAETAAQVSARFPRISTGHDVSPDRTEFRPIQRSPGRRRRSGCNQYSFVSLS